MKLDARGIAFLVGGLILGRIGSEFAGWRGLICFAVGAFIGWKAGKEAA